MAWEEQFLALVAASPQFSFLFGLIAPFVGGDPVILTLGFFAGQGSLSLSNIILGSFVGIFIFDSASFLLVRSSWGERLRARGREWRHYRKLEQRLENIAHHNDIVILFLSKVMVGTRLLIIAYIGMRSISFWRFALYDSIASFIWAVILGGVGWYAGVGYFSVAQAEGVVTAISVLAVVTAICVGIAWFVRWIITRK